MVTLLPVMIFGADGPSDESSQYMQYWTNLNWGAFDIEGKVEGDDGWLKTTYDSRYYTKLIIGELTGEEDLYYTGDWVEGMQNGVEKLYPYTDQPVFTLQENSLLEEQEPLLGLTQTLSLQYNDRYVKIQYKVRNISDAPQTFSLGSFADVEIGEDDLCGYK